MTYTHRAARVAVAASLTLVPATAAAQRVAPAPGAAGAQPPPYGAQPSPYGAQPSPYGAQPQPSPYGNMQAGGLAPPPPMATPAQSQAGVEEDLDRAKREDSGRGLSWVWLEAEGGYEIVGLRTFDTSSEELTAGFVETSASGPMIGAGAGLRLLFLTLGARARLGFFDPWQMFSVGGELGLRLPLGNFEPHLAFGAGYTGLGDVNGAVSGANDAISVHGFDARVGGGLDYYVTPAFSVGAGVSWELLALTRPAVDATKVTRLQASTTPAQGQASLLAAEGSSYGSALAISAQAGLHF